MHVLFVHQNFPAQFGHIARAIARDKGWQSTVVCGNPTGTAEGPNIIQYELKGGATEKTHYCSRSFEMLWRTALGFSRHAANIENSGRIWWLAIAGSVQRSSFGNLEAGRGDPGRCR